MGAGVIGQTGLGPLLAALTGLGGPPRILPMGHSFGARLVAYALAGQPVAKTGPQSPVKSLTLIQGTFSHFTFASPRMFDPSRSGGLASMGDRVDGPLLATFSAAERALGWWYPTASMLADQDAEVDLGAHGLDYRWGGMGHDGYQQNPSATTMLLAEPGNPYPSHRPTSAPWTPTL